MKTPTTDAMNNHCLQLIYENRELKKERDYFKFWARMFFVLAILNLGFDLINWGLEWIIDVMS